MIAKEESYTITSAPNFPDTIGEGEGKDLGKENLISNVLSTLTQF
jgi:hypothetical protein